jgi:hypothetical protein
MARFFTDHPHQAGETYFQHQRFATRFGVRLILAGFAAMIHGLIPCLFVTTAGDMVQDLNGTIARRRAGMRQGIDQPLAEAA